MPYDKSTLKINGRKYALEYDQRDGSLGAAGFGFKILETESDESVGYLRVLLYGTASAVWSHNTAYPYQDQVAEVTVRLAIDAVVPTLNLRVGEDWFEAMRYKGDMITIQITTQEDSEAEEGALITLKSYKSPEEFVARHLYGETNDPARIRNAILSRLNNWEETSYGIPYGTRELQKELFLSRIVVHRTIDYLAGPGVGYISKSAAGNDEFNLKLSPAGTDYLASLDGVATLATSVFNQTSFDQSVFEGLTRVDPSLGRSYEQIVADLNDENRKSWKGTANELRDTLSTLLRTIAPDKAVTAQEGYVQEKNATGPTQRQRVVFILSDRNAGSNELEVAKEVDQFEGRVGVFVRKFYSRASNSAHLPTERKEVLKLHSYFVAFMRDLLDLET